MAPRYRLIQDAFFPPQKIFKDSVIEWTGTPGPHMEPLNEEAYAAMEAYYKAYPEASLNPVDGLRLEGGDPGEMKVLEEPGEAEVPVLSIADISGNAEDTIAAKGRARKAG